MLNYDKELSSPHRVVEHRNRWMELRKRVFQRPSVNGLMKIHARSPWNEPPLCIAVDATHPEARTLIDHGVYDNILPD
jgi:hypothetical protein